MCSVVLTGGIGVSISEEAENWLGLVIIFSFKGFCPEKLNGYAHQGFKTSTITTGCKVEDFDKWTKTSSTDWKMVKRHTSLSPLRNLKLRHSLRTTLKKTISG